MLHSHNITLQIYKNIQMREMFTCIGIPKFAKHWRLSLFRYETFITFMTFRFSTRGERDTIFPMLTVPSDPTTRSVSRRPNWPGLAQIRKPTRFVLVQISTHCFFFKNHPKSSSHRFRAWRHSHSQSYFLSGVFIMTSVIITSSPREREHLRSMCAPTRVLSRIVLSLTKLKDKI